MKTILKVTLIVAAILAGLQFGAGVGVAVFIFGAILFSPHARYAFGVVDVKPATWFAGYDGDATAHTIKFNTNDAPSNKTLPQLVDAKADPDTGDVREVLFAICEAAYQYYKGLTTKPKQVTITRSVITSRDGSVSNSYTLKFGVTPPTGQYTIPDET